MADLNTIEEAVEFWQSRTSKVLTIEDGREIVSNVTGFFQLLDQWDRSSTDSASSHSIPETEDVN